MFLNPFNWGKKREPTPAEAEAAAADAAAAAELAARADAVARRAAGDEAARGLERQLRGLAQRVEETLKKMELAEGRRDEEMARMAAADQAGSEARKKVHWRNKKRAEEEVKSLTAHLGQLEDMRATCEKRVSQVRRQEDLEFATEALGRARVDVEHVESVMEEAKAGVENVADVEAVMNSFQLGGDVDDEDEMERELAAFEAKGRAKGALTDGEVGRLVEPEVPGAAPAPAGAQDAELERLERELAT